MTGKTIYIEGGDGTGKSTQRKRVAQRLGDAGYKVHLAHEPGGGLGQPIRDIIFSRAVGDLPLKPRGLTSLFLFLADRAAHVVKLDELRRAGYIVLSDRGPWSSVVYQGYAEGVDVDTVISLNTLAMQGVEEDLVIVLDADPRELGDRLDARGDKNRFDDASLPYRMSIRTGFSILARKNGWPMVDAIGSEEEVTERILSVLHERLGLRSDKK